MSGGVLRGRRLTVPRGIRPTTELARKAAFDILGPRIRGVRVLDAAAGSGAYGIEALSRGAREAVFVEASGPVARTLSRNLEALSLTARAVVRIEDVARFLGRGEGGFDVIFFDPPWGEGRTADLEGLLAARAPGGVLVYERAAAGPPPPVTAPSSERRYGRTLLHIYQG